MENKIDKLKSIREKRRIVDAIHSTDKKIDFLEKEIINAIGLDTKNSQNLSTIASLIKQYQKSSNKSQSIELLFDLPIETEDNFDIFDRVEYNKKINNERKNLYMKQNQIKRMVMHFKDQVHTNENSVRYLENLKSMMEEIESNIVIFKENQKKNYEDLLITEKRLTQELSIFQEHLNEWDEKKTKKEWLVKRNSYTHGLSLKRKESQNSSSFSFSSTPTPNINLAPVPPEVTMEAKAIIKYGYHEGKKKFSSSSLDHEFDIDVDLAQLDEELANAGNENNKKYLKSERYIMDTDMQDNSMSTNDYSDNKRKNSFMSSFSSSSSLKSTYLSDVERFRNFYVRNHGRTGGWDELSHSMFEKIWKKIGPTNSRFEQTCLDSIPGLDMFSLEKHIQWYKTYQELEQKKKEALKNWRLENKKKRIENQRALNINPSHIELEMKNKMNKEKKRKEEEERQKIKQKVKLWKEKKRLEEEKENYIANEEKKKEKELEDKKLQIKQKLNKEKLKLYEEKKKHETSSGKDNKKSNDEHAKEKKKVNLKYFQEKDKKYLNEKLQRKLKNQKEKSDKALRLEKIKSVNIISVDHDPNRIFQPTKTFQNYVNSISHNKSNGIFADIEHVNAFFNPNELHHRAIPVWRKGIS